MTSLRPVGKNDESFVSPYNSSSPALQAQSTPALRPSPATTAATASTVATSTIPPSTEQGARSISIGTSLTPGEKLASKVHRVVTEIPKVFTHAAKKKKKMSDIEAVLSAPGTIGKGFHFVDIPREELEELYPDLVKTHVREKTPFIYYDLGENVLLTNKSGKWRLYWLKPVAPAIAENQSLKEVLRQGRQAVEAQRSVQVDEKLVP